MAIKYINIPIRRGSSTTSVDTITAFQIDLPYVALNSSGYTYGKHTTLTELGIEEPVAATNIIDDISIHQSSFNFPHIPPRFEDGTKIAYYYSKDAKSRAEIYVSTAIYSILGGSLGHSFRAWFRREDLAKTWSNSRLFGVSSSEWYRSPRLYFAVSSDGVVFLMAFGSQMVADNSTGDTAFTRYEYNDDTVAWGIFPENNATIDQMKLEYFFNDVTVDESSRYDESESDEGNIIRDDSSDVIDTPLIPSISPSVFTHVYKMNPYLLSAFKSELFSDNFWDVIKKWFSKPMDSIVALNIVPLSLSEVTNLRSIQIGTRSMDAQGYLADGTVFKVDCGSVDINEYYKNYADYEQTIIQVYIPYVGFIPIKTVDVMSGKLHLEYMVNIVTGDFVAFLKVTRNKFNVNLSAVLYETSGNMFAQIPVTSSDYSNVIQGVLNTITSTATTVASAVTGNVPGMVSGGLGIASGISQMASSPAIQRSGSFNKNASICTMRKPFVLFERPRIAIPSSFQKEKGFTANYSAKLSALSGYTEISHCHIDNINNATPEEKREIESLLKNGVIL